MKNKSIAFMMMMGLLLAFGCGGGDDDNSGDDGSGGNNNDSGTTEVALSVDEDKTASEMTSDEINAVCGDIYDAIMETTAQMETAAEAFKCQGLAVMMTAMTASTDGSDADLAASCEETLEACENGEMDEMLAQYEEPAGESMTEEDFCEGAEEGVGDCDATAGEIANCFAAMFDAEMAATTAMMTQMPACGELTADALAEMSEFEEMPEEEFVMPAACEVIQEKCPEMLEDME